MERAAGLEVSSLCNRHDVDVGSSQLSFLQFVVAPTFNALRPLAPRTAATALRCLKDAQVLPMIPESLTKLTGGQEAIGIVVS